MCLVFRGTVVKCWSQLAASLRACVQNQRGTYVSNFKNRGKE